eukprot:scpid23618/ scgid26458/ Probable Pol polyprotein; Reverse transcriptase/ribonuclease H; Integrase
MLDLYSRYPIVAPLRSESTAAVLSACNQVFTLFGTPRRIISDNGPQFVSAEFASACQQWNTSHKRIVPYSPRQNPVERLHQTLKRHMRKSGCSSADEALQRALRTVRSTINTITGRAPGDLFLRGGYNTPLRCLKEQTESIDDDDDESDTDEEVRIADATAKATAKARFDARHLVQPKVVNPGAAVFLKEPSGNIVPAVIVHSSPHDVTAITDAGVERRRHLDSVIPRPSSDSTVADSTAATPNEPQPSHTVSADAPNVRRSERRAQAPARLNL